MQELTILEHSIRMSTAQVGPQEVLHKCWLSFYAVLPLSKWCDLLRESTHREPPCKGKLENSVGAVFRLCPSENLGWNPMLFVYSPGIPPWPIDSREPNPHCTTPRFTILRNSHLTHTSVASRAPLCSYTETNISHWKAI